MEPSLSAATIKTPLLEIDDDLRGMLLSDRARATAAIALHLSLRVGRHYVFRRMSEKASLDEVVREIVEAVWRVPLNTIAHFAKTEDKFRATATNAIAREVFLGLTTAFEVQYVREPYGGG